MADLPPETRIVRALPCMRCGYSLEGLKLSDRCPECGDPAEGALGHLLLLEERPLLRLRRAATLVAVSSLGMPCMYLGAMLLSILIWSARLRGAILNSDAMTTVAVVFLIAFAVSGCFGWFGLSRVGHARGPLSSSFGSLRDVEPAVWRVALLVAAVTYAAGASLAILLAIESNRLGRRAEEAIPVALAVLAACWSVRNVCGMRAIGTVARRAGARRLLRSSRFWMVINGLNLPLILITGLVLYPLLLLGGTGIERKLGFAASLMGICAASIIGLATLANGGIGIAVRVVLGRLLRARNQTAGPYLLASPPATLTPEPNPERIGT